MIAVRKSSAAPGVILADVSEPVIRNADDVIVEVAAAGICGSDLHIDHWIPDYAFLVPALPVTLGHEFSGHIVEVGSGVEKSVIGTRVVVKPSVPCGVCSGCNKGDPDDCRDRKPIGLLQDGAFTRLVRTPFAQCIEIPDNLDIVTAALAEPLTISEHAVQDGDIGAGSRVLIFGPGTIGQGAAILARQAGATDVVVVGHNDGSRIETLRCLGFDQLIDLAEDNAEAKLNGLAAAGFDTVIEAAGVGAAFELGLRCLRPRGILVAVGIHRTNPSIDINLIVRRRLQIRGSYRASHAIWTKVIESLATNQEAFRRMITHELPIYDALNGFQLGHRRQASKVILKPAV